MNLGSIKDEIVKPVVHLDYIDTTLQAADIFTKALGPHKWQRGLDMLNIVPGPLPKWVYQRSLRAPQGGKLPSNFTTLQDVPTALDTMV